MEQEEQEEEQDQQEDANQEVEALTEEDIRNFRSELRQKFFSTSRVWVWEPCDMIDSCNMYSPEPHLGWLRSALQAWRHCWGPQDRWMLGRQRFIQTVQISLAALSGHDHSQAHSGGKEGATTCGDVTQRQKSHELSTRANCRGWFVSFAQQTILGGSFSCSDFRREL